MDAEMASRRSHITALPWGTDLTSWTDPAPTEAPPFEWQGQQWSLSFDFLDSDQEEDLLRRVVAAPAEERDYLEKQLRLAWSIDEWNGQNFAESVLRRAIDRKEFTLEQVREDPRLVVSACEAFMAPVKGPLLLALAQAYEAAARRSLGLLAEMRDDPFSGREPWTPGESFAPVAAGQDGN